jgi:Zn-dependent protease
LILFTLLELLEIDPAAALIFATALGTALVIGIGFHEFSHAYVADSLGDHTPRAYGRVTLNPLAHLEPIGTVLIFVAGFGWGRPVPVNPWATRNPQGALWMTAAAGPLSNFLVAAAAGLPLRFGLLPWLPPFNPGVLLAGNLSLQEYAGLYLSTVVLISIILGVFNLLPIAPLDGFKVVAGLLPRNLSRVFAQMEPYGPIVLIFLIALPFLTEGQFGILFTVMRPLINVLAGLFAGVEGDVYS